MQKMVYVGAGLDFVPLVVLSSIKEFIYVDSQPFSEYGSLLYDDQNNTTYTFGTTEEQGSAWQLMQNTGKYNAFSRPFFLNRMEWMLQQLGYLHISSSSSSWLVGDKTSTFGCPDKKKEYVVLFYNPSTSQTIKYFYNCSFPEMVTPTLLKELKTCNTLCMMGFLPDSILLTEMMMMLTTDTIYIICNNETAYYQKKGDDDYFKSVSWYLLQQEEQQPPLSLENSNKNSNKYRFLLLEKKK